MKPPSATAWKDLQEYRGWECIEKAVWDKRVYNEGRGRSPELKRSVDRCASESGVRRLAPGKSTKDAS